MGATKSTQVPGSGLAFQRASVASRGYETEPEPTAMVNLRPAEEWARRVVEVHLGRPVEAHDDNSAPGLFDLRVGPADAPDIAIEVTGAIDPPWTKTWNAAGKLSGPVAGIDGDWTLIVRPGANLRRIVEQTAALLQPIAAAGLDALHDTDSFHDPELRARFRRLGVRGAYRVGQPGSGHVHLTLDGDGGAIDSAGKSVPGWVADFLADPERADILRKLPATAASQREVFIVADVMGAPWSVMSYLTEISPLGMRLPPAAPRLPQPVTGVWLASTLSFSGKPVGVRWDGTQWSSFRSRGAGIDDD